jgi:hypothetical protein
MITYGVEKSIVPRTLLRLEVVGPGRAPKHRVQFARRRRLTVVSANQEQHASRLGLSLARSSDGLGSGKRSVVSQCRGQRPLVCG